MGEFSRRLFGYSKKQVDQRIEVMNQQNEDNMTHVDLLEQRLKDRESEIVALKKQIDELNDQLAVASNRVDVLEKTQEEIARMALKEASTLINKAKHNANLILTESLLYVRSLSGEMDDFKYKAANFRKAVVEMSKDLVDTIDNSDVFTILNEDNKD